MVTGQRLNGCCVPPGGGLRFGALQVSREPLALLNLPAPALAGWWAPVESGSPGPLSPASSTCSWRELQFRLQQENVVLFPGAGGREAKPGDCLLRRLNLSLLPHCLPQSILLSDVSVTRDGEGDVTGVQQWNSLSSLGWKRPTGVQRG